jgi:hypothetical protein
MRYDTVEETGMEGRRVRAISATENLVPGRATRAVGNENGTAPQSRLDR